VALDDGSTIVLRGAPQIQLQTFSGQLQTGDLVLAGPGKPPAWWADLASKNRVHPSGAPSGATDVPDGLCWKIAGGAFDEGGAIHFSNGLLLKKTADFKVVYSWIPDPFPARSDDNFCVNRAGEVTTLDFIWEPY